MCVRMVKSDQDSNSDCAKFCIVVLGNHECISYEYSKLYDPILKYSYFCLLIAKAGGSKHLKSHSSQ